MPDDPVGHESAVGTAGYAQPLGINLRIGGDGAVQKAHQIVVVNGAVAAPDIREPVTAPLAAARIAQHHKVALVGPQLHFVKEYAAVGGLGPAVNVQNAGIPARGGQNRRALSQSLRWSHRRWGRTGVRAWRASFPRRCARSGRSGGAPRRPAAHTAPAGACPRIAHEQQRLAGQVEAVHRALGRQKHFFPAGSVYAHQRRAGMPRHRIVHPAAGKQNRLPAAQAAVRAHVAAGVASSLAHSSAGFPSRSA